MTPVSPRAYLLAVLALSAIPVAPTHAETPSEMCARVRTDDTVRPIPESLAPAVNAAFGTNMPAGIATATTLFRCADAKVLVCTVGANLPCGPANTSTIPASGMTDWCRSNPDADFIPAVVVGHDTIFAWRCQNGSVGIVRQVEEVDARGFIARVWKTLP